MTAYTLNIQNRDHDLIIPSDTDTDNKLELISDDNNVLTDREFPGWWGNADDGDTYISQWVCDAVGHDRCNYQIIFEFPAVKGDEPDDDGWPWGDASFIVEVWETY